MAYNLTTNITVPNLARLIAQRPNIDDDNNIMTVTIEVRTTAPTDFVIGYRSLYIRNGLSDRLVKNTAPTAGLQLLDALITYQANGVSTPTGFTDAVAAWAGGGASATAKRNALEAALKTMGAFDQATLAGS